MQSATLPFEVTAEELEALLEGVREVVRITQPFKLASRQLRNPARDMLVRPA